MLAMSAYGTKADIVAPLADVRFRGVKRTSQFNGPSFR